MSLRRTVETEKAYALDKARYGRHYSTCETCGAPVVGWVAIPPVEIEYCRVCTTFDQAYKLAQHKLEQSPSDA